MAQVLIYSSLKALCKNYHMQDKGQEKQENYQRKKSIFGLPSIILRFFEWPVAGW